MATEAENTVTFMLEDEDHTLGATLVDILNRSPHVTFAGYTIPHPSERKVQLSIQTTGEVQPKEALENACASLTKMCSFTKELFSSQVEAYRKSNANAMQE